jgi:hypothetical protein
MVLGFVQGYKSSTGAEVEPRDMVVQEHYMATGVVQGYRSSTCVWVQGKCSATGVPE